MSESILYESTFTIDSLNNQKYDRVSRISTYSEDKSTMLMLDLNTELYPVAIGDRVKIALALTLNLDGSKDDTKGWREVGNQQTLADEYDYVCHGKIYRFEEGQGDNIHVFISFGGLLCYIQGPYSQLNAMRIDHVYLLMKK